MRLAASLLLLLIVVAPSGNDLSAQRGVGRRPYPYVIEQGTPDSDARAGDAELARWALDDWERHANDRIHFLAAAPDAARLRIRFVGPRTGQYGETERMRVGTRMVSVVNIRPDTSALGAVMADATRVDPLLRDAVVYLTCVHELGHAIGLPHTADERDIMYSFQFGGDVYAFFMRYRQQLKTRADIATTSGLSAGDVSRLRVLLAPRGRG